MAPRLFIALPQDLDSLVDSDPTSDDFRLACSVSQEEGSSFNQPRHKHISNHQGYSIARPQEFFQKFGAYTLRIPKMVQNGFNPVQNPSSSMRINVTHRLHEMPSLDMANILWNCEPETTGGQLFKNTIGPLVNKAIAYLQEQLP